MLTTRFDDPNAVPYFLWDEPITIKDLREKLYRVPDAERMRLLGKILREARDTDVWYFTSPSEIRSNWDKLSKYLGRRRAFWEFLLTAWEREGLIA